MNAPMAIAAAAPRTELPSTELRATNMPPARKPASRPCTPPAFPPRKLVAASVMAMLRTESLTTDAKAASIAPQSAPMTAAPKLPSMRRPNSDDVFTAWPIGTYSPRHMAVRGSRFLEKQASYREVRASETLKCQRHSHCGRSGKHPLPGTLPDSALQNARRSGLGLVVCGFAHCECAFPTKCTLDRNTMKCRLAGLLHYEDLHVAFPPEDGRADIVLMPDEEQIHRGVPHAGVVQPQLIERGRKLRPRGADPPLRGIDLETEASLDEGRDPRRRPSLRRVTSPRLRGAGDLFVQSACTRLHFARRRWSASDASRELLRCIAIRPAERFSGRSSARPDTNTRSAIDSIPWQPVILFGHVTVLASRSISSRQRSRIAHCNQDRANCASSTGMTFVFAASEIM